MKYQIFTVPVFNSAAAMQELNTFISQKRVCKVEKEFVANGDHSFWSFCVSWLDSQGPLPANPSTSKRIDYKEVLNEQDFAVYAQLREWRKQVAQRDGTPPYNVFTNEQLASLVTEGINNKTALRAIDGIGQTRVDKYAEEVLSFLQSLHQGGNGRNETNSD